MAAEPICTATAQSSDAQMLVKFQERCYRLNEALEAERAKTSKLRRYISRLNTKPAPHFADIQPEQPELQSLITEQAKLIEQLYRDNQALQVAAKNRSAQNEQLVTANEKLKARIIELRRQVREYAERQLASQPKARPPSPLTATLAITEAPVVTDTPIANKAPRATKVKPVTTEAPRSWLPASVSRLLHR